MENNNQQPEKEYPLVKNIIKYVVIGIAALCTVSTVQAVFRDNTMVNLDNNLESAGRAYFKSLEAEKQMIELRQFNAEAYCNAWKAAKAYKESKGIELKDPNNNICIAVKAPQEGF